MQRKLVIVSRSTPLHRLGGMEVVLWDLAQEFSRQGDDVTVLTTSLPGEESPKLVNGIKLVCLPCASGRYSLKWWFLSRRYFDRNLAQRTDVVLSISAGAFALSRRRTQAQFVAQLHGTAWGEFISKLRQRRIVPWLTSLRNLGWLVRDIRYRMFDVLTFVGPAVLAEASSMPMSAIVGQRSEKRLIANGIDQTAFAFCADARLSTRASLGYTEQDRVVVWSSRLHNQKGVMEGLRSFEAAAREDATLKMLILGEGPERAALDKYIAENNLRESVKLTGRLKREELPTYLSASDLFLFTTKRVEGLPMNLLEALANGLPAIISHSINHPDFGSIGVDPNDHIATARAIAETNVTSSRQTRLQRQYTLTYSADEYRRLFSTIASGAL